MLKVFPKVDDLAGIVPTDLLGNGTACLVWSSSLPGDAGRPMRYVNLMGSSKPHLLVKMVNNLGAETRLSYAPSTKFYLQDRLDGRPWMTRLPFPVHVVERVEIVDHISRNRFVTRYAYHHGYFDGEEREFRGFGMVEQWDTEAGGTALSHVPPVHTKTWFHTGVHVDRDASEFFGEPSLAETMPPEGLTAAEHREALRALKGSMLRQEVYADDAGPDATPEQIQRASTPYTVTEQNFTIRASAAEGRQPSRRLLRPCPRGDQLPLRAQPGRLRASSTDAGGDYGNVLKQRLRRQRSRRRRRAVQPVSTRADRTVDG